jgi:hypothetical protein
MAALQFQQIGMTGFSSGSIKFDKSAIEWRSSLSTIPIKRFEDITQASWAQYGVKGHLFVTSGDRDNKSVCFDGFEKGDFRAIADWFENNCALVNPLEKEDVSYNHSISPQDLFNCFSCLVMVGTLVKLILRTIKWCLNHQKLEKMRSTCD